MAVEPGPLPTYSEAVYKRPNPDGTRKSCSKCMMFVKGENRCVIHPKDLTVRSHYYCNYHIFGTPMEKWMDHPGMMSVDPAFSGLRLAGGGVSCDICVYYAATGDKDGFCTALAPEEGAAGPAKVAALAMCARFRVS